MRTYRVLQIYSGNLYGGIETLLVTLARSRPLFPQIERSFALCYHGRLWDELVAAGAPVFDLGPVRFSRPWTLFRARSRLRRILRENKFDAVMTHACWPHAAFAGVVRRAGLRLVLSVHDELKGKDWVERLAGRVQPDMIVANSRFSAFHARKVFPCTPMRVVYHPVPPVQTECRADWRAQVRKEFGTPEQQIVIFQASRLERWKGQHVHLHALSKLRELPGWEAWFAGGVQKAGEQAYFEELQQIVKAGGITDRVRFLGQRSDVPRLMAAADIYCQPNSGPEPFGLSFVEALATGLPVVTSNVGGGAEIVTAECGILTPPDDADAVADALKDLIVNLGRLKELSMAAPARAAKLCDLKRQIARRAVCLLGDQAGPDLLEAAEMQTFERDTTPFPSVGFTPPKERVTV